VRGKGEEHQRLPSLLRYVSSVKKKEERKKEGKKSGTVEVSSSPTFKKKKRSLHGNEDLIREEKGKREKTKKKDGSSK